MRCCGNRTLPALLLVLFLGACEDRQPPPATDQSVRPARIFSVGADVGTVRHEFVGAVEAAQTIDMSFRVPGPLTELPILEGQFVEAGALVAAIEATDYTLALREAQVQRELARQDYTRKQRLLTERGISQSIVDDARALFDLRQVAVEKARENLDRTRLRAPFQAYVAQRFIDNHVNVHPGDPIVRLMDLSELFVVANVPENLLATATAERVQRLEAEFGFAPGERFELTFRESRGESNAVAQTFEVTFTMPRPENWNVLPGMTATVIVELAATLARERIQIPTSALVADPEKNYFVWKFDPESQLVTRQAVEIGPATGNGISILAGLSPGDLIVASGAAHLQPGMRVRMLGQPTSTL